jgi:hypothetical protein
MAIEAIDNRDYAADVAPAFNSYDIVVAMRAIATKDRTEENYDADALSRNERHLKIKMAIPAFVKELSAEQKKKIEDLSL